MPALRRIAHFGHDQRDALLSNFSACAFDDAIAPGGKTSVAASAPVIGPQADEPIRSISVGGTATGVVDTGGDVDNFTVSLIAGQTYMISLRGTGATPLGDAYLAVNRPNGTELGVDDEGGLGHDALITFTASASGTYTILAQGYPGQGSTGAYTIDVRQMGSDNSSPAASTFMPIGTTVLNFIETSNDVDTYAVNLLAGHTYSFEVAGGADYNTDYQHVPAGELDTQLSLYDSNSNQVAFNEDIAFPDDISSGFTFSPTADGTYYLGVNAYAGQTGGYVVTAQELDLSGMDPLDTIDWGTQLASHSATVYFAPAGQTFDGVTSLGWSQYEIDRAMAAFQTWADVANLTFTITNNSAGATFKLVTTNSNDFLGYFNPPGTANAGVGVFAKNGSGWDTTGGLEEGGYGFITLVHEFGHGLGLAHPHDDGGTSTIMPGVTGPFDSLGVYDLNQGVYTTMSYNDGWQLNPSGTSPSLNYGYQGGPSALDIALIQAKYGATTANTGNNVYYLPTTNVAGTYYDVIWDTGGTDTLAFTGTVSARIDLTAATLDYSATGGGVISYATGIFGGYTIAAGVVIENATGGSGADILIGNSAANVIDGGAGNDTLEGRGGNDTFNFDSGDGQDTITDLTAGDIVHITGYSAAQSVVQNGANVLATFAPGNTITFLSTTVATVQGALQFPAAGPTEGPDTLTGTSGDDVINALGGNDTVNGLGGNDTIDGGTGADRMDGGAGNDGYVVDNAGDVVIESSSSGGTDTVSSSVSFALGSQYIENLVLTGSAAINGTGNSLDNVITGNASANTLGGRNGNDTLSGMGGNDVLDGSAGNDSLDGGTGADTMDGGAGDDSYIVDNAGDVTVETMQSLGFDTVYASVSFAMGTQYIDNLVLTGGAAITGLGNSLDNVITGNGAVNTLGGRNGSDTLLGMGGNDILDGASGNDVLDGGAGADRMEGSSGNDTYYVDDAGDVVLDSLPAGGADTVFSSVTYSVATQYIETLVLTGTAAINGTGNSLANSITGNSASNTLSGGNGNDLLDGGGGADTLIGGNGDDIYYVDDLGDAIVENGSTAGIDTVSSSVSFAFGTQYLDNLILTGTDAINGSGNSLANSITGNSASNMLSGGNGSDVLNGLGGNDTLIGGASNDSFVFSGTPGNDTVNDFACGADKIDLSAYGITMAQVSTAASGANTIVSVDSDSNGVSDFTITLIGVGAPQEADYVF
jgi:Ca2+-binding RTX toxin-like protein